MDHTQKQRTFSKERKNVMIGDWFQVELFCSVQETVYVLHSNYGISPVKSGLHLSERL